MESGNEKESGYAGFHPAMKTYSLLVLAVALLAGGCQTTPSNPNPAASGDVTVNFTNPDKFTDVRDSVNGAPSQYYLDELSKYIKDEAARHLTAGQKLTVTFSDIDLAGDIPPGSTHDIRIMKEIYIPRMELHFQLVDSAGAVISEGDRRLVDMNFMQNLRPTFMQNEPLRYDKGLLEDWIRREFPMPTKPATP